MTYIVYYNDSYTRYILDELRDIEDVTLVEVPHERKSQRRLMSLNRFLKIEALIPAARDPRLSSLIREVKEEDTLILFDYFKFANAVHIIRNIPCRNIHFWFWNTVTDEEARLFPFSKDRRIKFHTFDPADAAKYGLILNNQFYREPSEKLKNVATTNDFFFIGKKKGRVEFLYNLNSRLKNLGFSTKIIVKGHVSKKENTSGLELIKKMMGYDEVLDLIASSRVLLDITKDEQSGITLRCLEGLFFNKKVITNNKSVSGLPFYDERNFLILSDDIQEKRLRDFLATPYEPCSAQIKNRYTVRTWFSSILSSDD